MINKDLTITLLVSQDAATVFNAVNNVRGWWSESLEGESRQLNDEFVYRYKDLHYSRHRLTEVVQDKKVMWLVLDSSLSFIKDKNEWTGTTQVFEIMEKNGQTELRFTHHGLVPEVECFDACRKGWTYFIEQSLLPLITSGKGKPNILDEKVKANGKQPA